MRTLDEGFREANIAHDLSWVFRRNGYLAFPEFPFDGGSIDAVFVRDREVVACEWTRFYRRAKQKVIRQSERLLRFDPRIELPKHGFSIRPQVYTILWVCDVWFESDGEWWLGRAVDQLDPCPFGRGWKVGREDFSTLQLRAHQGVEFTYSWLWASKEKRLTRR